MTSDAYEKAQRLVEAVSLPDATGASGENLQAREQWEKTYEAMWDGLPMPVKRPVPPTFPVALLGALAPMVRAVSESFQTADDFAAFCALGAVSTLVRGRVQVQVKPDWTELHTGVYLNAFGDPSESKSPVLREMFAPVYASVAELRDKIGDPSLLDKDFVLPRAVIEDITFEALITQLGKHQGALGLVSDEGGIFRMLSGMYAANRKANDTIMRTGYSGSPYTYDRKTESVQIDRVCMTLCVLAQPGVLDGMEAQNPDFRSTGYLARILYALPIPLDHYSPDEPPIPKVVRADYERRLTALFNAFWRDGLPYTVEETLPMAGMEWGGPSRDIHVREVPEPKVMTLPEAVRRDFIEFNADLRNRAKQHGDLHDIADWTGKLGGSLIRIATLLTLYEDPDADVLAERYVRNAIDMEPYFTAHARHAFGLMSKQGAALRPAERVLTWIQTHTAYGKPFTLSDAHQFFRNQTSWYGGKEDAVTALNTLERYDWVQRVSTKKAGAPGRPSVAYVAHPYTYDDEFFATRRTGVFSVSSAESQGERVTQDGATADRRLPTESALETPETPQEQKAPRRAAPAKRNPPTRLTQAQKDEVLAAYLAAPSMTYKKLGDRYGVSESVIHRCIPAEHRRPRGKRKGAGEAA
ncbi:MULTISPECIES: DUF3987 domain-containing protein [Streptomyces]|uniref:DUF3987 domain-containing protein n=1 Tax=Streptomyces TaxID=1883 RepID=UPI00345BE4EC